MTIVAVSMHDSDLEQLERLQKIGGFPSRSEVVRAAIQSLLSEYHVIETLEGDVTLIATILYSERKSEGCSRAQHKHGHLLSALMHAHSTTGDCMDIMVVKGSSDEIRTFLRELRNERCVTRVLVNVVEA
ncbi:MAG: CopG family ribbon-helix-helix protein [Candidatus Thorarchaeota archaeon]|nr:CopG family ribbon-helix-helix protein [Candidatus Thorarchaeota archaeon]